MKRSIPEHVHYANTFLSKKWKAWDIIKIRDRMSILHGDNSGEMVQTTIWDKKDIQSIQDILEKHVSLYDRHEKPINPQNKGYKKI